jgi:CheY-like chemotaxis protein
MSARVLVVDDERAIAHNLQAFLEDEGMEVTCVHAGETAVQMVRNGAEFDACVMDLRLPGMNGNMTVLALHALRPRMHFVIHTGSADYDIPAELRMIGLGDADLFHKPLPDMGVLAARLRELLAH